MAESNEPPLPAAVDLDQLPISGRRLRTAECRSFKPVPYDAAHDSERDRGGVSEPHGQSLPEAADLDQLPVSGHEPRTPERRPFDPTPYDPAQDRERVRGWIAVGLSLLFAVLVITSLAAVLAGWLRIDDLEKIAAVLISPLSGLLGAVIGFYYGEQSRGPA